MYHAYHAQDSVYVGRQALVDRISWSTDGWPVINSSLGPSFHNTLADENLFSSPPGNKEHTFFDSFSKNQLTAGWQWPFQQKPKFKLDAKISNLILESSSAGAPVSAVLARATSLGDYVASTTISLKDLQKNVSAGLAAYGNPENYLAIFYRDQKIFLFSKNHGKESVLASLPAPTPSGKEIHFKITASRGSHFQFAYSSDEQTWQSLGSEMEGSFLPPWDLGVRMALFSGNGSARFDDFKMSPVTR